MVFRAVFASLALALALSRVSAGPVPEAIPAAAVYSDIEYQGTTARIPVSDSCVDLTIVNNGMNETAGIGSMVIPGPEITCSFYETCDCSGGTFGQEFQFSASTPDVRQQYRDLAQLSIDSIKCKSVKNFS
ncbi:uncharacterized protein BO72DRAFT_524640 [Aspergillus fijiensis CBS 313.89]|uniref:Uncharacterized protein n=1 Tax=Aspergillus fijiensis CBS 313.89 TaxID=1448319 RepID=A0A8G1S0Q2_9EURO|nr:uncharacterized protein BO72DRAFT_524640 [Aspergillus fijiensis CBS 313.89]RAK81176.1 hypothetical protein BO72DRAFT_524640 [Aspergillus fijiensis CBS 313.89]